MSWTNHRRRRIKVVCQRQSELVGLREHPELRSGRRGDTESGLPSQGIWRAHDHRAAKLVPALKGETIYREPVWGSRAVVL